MTIPFRAVLPTAGMTSCSHAFASSEAPDAVLVAAGRIGAPIGHGGDFSRRKNLAGCRGFNAKTSDEQ